MGDIMGKWLCPYVDEDDEGERHAKWQDIVKEHANIMQDHVESLKVDKMVVQIWNKQQKEAFNCFIYLIFI